MTVSKTFKQRTKLEHKEDKKDNYVFRGSFEEFKVWLKGTGYNSNNK